MMALTGIAIFDCRFPICDVERCKVASNSNRIPQMEILKLPRLDSNQDKENQNLLCYRYTTG